MSTKTILVVDDDVDIRSTLSDFLEDQGYAVGEAANGREGLDYLREHPAPSVVLLDLMMPIMNGYQFRTEQKRDPAIAGVPVVVMTARGAVEASEIGVEHVLQKPFKLTKLLDAIHRAERSAATPTTRAPVPRSADCLAGGGEMGALMRSMDWAKTPLGPVHAWPQSLRTSVSTCLNSRFPILLWWGPKMVMLYNDAYRPILGTTKHPMALGTAGREVWPEVWHIIGPMLEGVLSEGQATWSENQLLLLERHGFAEECYFTFSYSPIRDESGGIGGIFCAVTETTGHVLGERRLRTLRDIAALTVEAAEATDACRLASEALAGNPGDLPFGLIYLLEPDGKRACLAGAAGLRVDEPGAPSAIDLAGDDRQGWPLAEVVRTSKAVTVTDLERRFGSLPSAEGAQSARSARVLPLGLRGDVRLAGVLVAGLSPRLALDDSYASFLDLVAGHVAGAITSARALQEARERAEALAELDRAKTAFFSNISHEFRTPLTLMLGPLQDQLEGARGTLSPAVREDAEVVHRNGVRLMKLVNTLLDFARIEAGRVRATYEPTDLSSLTAGLVSVFRAATEKARLALEVDCPPLPEPVYVDREMWEKIVLNLVANAFKFTFEGRIAVSLRWGGNRVQLAVQDTGTGIAAEEVPYIFKRFHRIQGARARTLEGSGIGLALVQDLVKLHGGTVDVESVVGTGTTFTVSIPTGSAHLPQDRIAASRPGANTSGNASSYAEEAMRWLPGEHEAQPSPAAPHADDVGPEPFATLSTSVPAHARILVVDDNADMREYLARLLRDKWAVDTAPNGASALAIARTHPPDLVLTDVMMPELDGFALVRELRADPVLRAIPVIMLSARAGEEARVEGIEAGADDYLVKPFSARELVARVGSQLAVAAARREVEREREARLDALQRTVRFSEMFVGILGHDLRNPLSAITAAAGLLSIRAGDSERIANPVARIVTSADRMARMIAQLLDFTSIRIGRGIPLRRSRVDLAEVVRAVIEELHPALPRDVQVEVTGETSGEWDRDRLSQLVSNLTANACQHSAPENPVQILVDGTDADSIRLEVRNQGIIPPDLVPRIFEPLGGRSGRAKAAGSSGLGLGLYITRQIALAHGGAIHVQSDEHRGTRFVIVLPRRQPTTSESDQVFDMRPRDIEDRQAEGDHRSDERLYER